MKKLLLMTFAGALVTSQFYAQTPVELNMQKVVDLHQGITGAEAKGKLRTWERDSEWNDTTSTWENVKRIIHENYSVDTSSVEQTTQDYVDSLGGWVNKSKTALYLNKQASFFDSIITYQWDAAKEEWLLAAKTSVEFSATNKPTLLKTELNPAIFGVPLPGMLLFATNSWYYDGNDFLIAEAAKQLDFGSQKMVNDDSTAYTNDGNGNPLTEEQLKWNSDNSVYVGSEKYTRTFNANDDLSTEVYETWDESNAVYINQNKSTFTYNTGNQLTERVVDIWDGSAFKALYRYKTTYNADGARETYTREEDKGSGYEFVWKETTSFDADGDPTKKLDEISDDNGTTWTNREMTEIFYSAVPTAPSAPTNLVVTPTNKTGAATKMNLTWTDNSNNEDGFYIYRSEDSTTLKVIDTVGVDVNSYEDTGLTPDTKYYYKVSAFNSAGNSSSNTVSATTLTGVEDPAAWKTSIFPNPTSAVLNINMSAQGVVSVKMYSVDGKIVYTKELNANGMLNAAINTNAFSKGMYVLRIENNGVTTIQSISVQ